MNPSEAQAKALHALPDNRALLLQYHLIWKEGEEKPVAREALRDAIAGQGGVIHSIAPVDMLAIGSNESAWEEIWLAEFRGSAAVAGHIASRAFADAVLSFSNLEIMVAYAPSPGIRRMCKWLNRILPLIPPPGAGSTMPQEELQGGINPTRAQFQAFQAADQSRPIHMFNLLKFHERARYEDGDRGISGQQAYEKGYGRVAVECFLRLGGRIVMLGRYRFTLVGKGGDPAPQAWNEIAVVQYPNRPAFTRMVATPKYIRALEHRHAGLAKTEVWSATPEGVFT